MATLVQKMQCERDTREMLRQGDLPQPDRVEYGLTCIRLVWDEPKLVVVVEIDEPPEGFEVVGEYLDDLDEDKPFEDRDDLDLDEPFEDPEDFDEDDALEELEQSDEDGSEEAT